ncbi:hypothetical protein D3C86_1315630 [compost metagenome]
MLGLQAFDLIGREAGVREHAALGDVAGERFAADMVAQFVVDGLAHMGDAFAHGRQLLLPAGAQGGRGQHAGHHAGAVGGRVAVVGAHGAGQLAQHAAGFVGALADHAQAAAALAIQREVLRERVGHQCRHVLAGQFAHGEGVVVEPRAKALVGHVHEGQQLARLEHRDDLAPLVLVQVHTGRVVAAGVQQHDATLRNGFDGRQHGVELQAARGGVVVRVRIHLEAGALEDHAVVLPARVADPHLRGGEVALQEVGTHAQRAGAAQRLQRGDAAFGAGGAVFAKHQRLHGLAVAGNASHRQVGARAHVREQRGFGFGHGLHHRQAAFAVEIDADAQVDLVGTRVLLEVLVEREDRVARKGFDMFEHGKALAVFQGAVTHCACTLGARSAAAAFFCRRR